MDIIANGQSNPRPPPVLPVLLRTITTSFDVTSQGSSNGKHVGEFLTDRILRVYTDQGNRTTPSYVAFTEGERLTGDGEYRKLVY